MYKVKFRDGLSKKLEKITARNPKMMSIIVNKMDEIRQNPHRYKNLRAPLNNWKRVHIHKSFVLTYSVDEEKKQIIFEDFDHHDKIYL